MMWRLAGRARCERGAITAEFAAAFPAVVLVLAIALGAIELGVHQLRLQEATFEAVRMLGRGDAGALDRIHTVAPGASLSVRRANGTVCADVHDTVAFGSLPGVPLATAACALDDA